MYLESIIEERKKYLIIKVLGEETHYYLYDGYYLEELREFEISLHRQKAHKKGGQSAPRFQRIRLNQIQEYVSKIEENLFEIEKLYPKIEKIIIGNGEIKDKISVSNLLGKIVYSNEEYLVKVKEIIQSHSLLVDENLVKSWIEKLDSGLILYGKEEIKENLDVVSQLLIVPEEESNFTEFKGEKYLLDNELLRSYGGVLATRHFTLIN